MKYILIDTAGQWTPVFSPSESKYKRIQVAKQLLATFSKVGQVCFIENVDFPRIRMMGDELSINGSLAASVCLSENIKRNQFSVLINPLNLNFEATVLNNTACISFERRISLNLWTLQ